MCASAKTISMLLYDGTLDGVTRLEGSSWNAGQLFAAPRDCISELLKLGACNKYGVYLLLSEDKVYAGQSSDLAKRITQHVAGKDWWQKVVVLTTKDDSLNHSDIDYLESTLIHRAQKNKRLFCENKNAGNPPKVDDYRKVYLTQYLDEALLLLELIGITVFSKREKRQSSTSLVVAANSSADNGRLTDSSTVEDMYELPQLPDESLKIGQYVYLSMRRLSESGYAFSSEQIDAMCTSEWSKKTFHTVKPFMKRYTPGQTDLSGLDGRNRFKKEPYVFGDQQVLVSKEWYERQRQLFINWYCALK